MKEKLITFETAKLAKEKGFKISCYHAYNVDNKLEECTTSELTGKVVKYSADLIKTLDFHSKDNECYLAPTQSLLQKWLREEHTLHIEIYVQLGFKHYSFSILPLAIEDRVNYKTYELALEAGLLEALKALKP